MADYYIHSTKYSIEERQTKKHGKVYDIRFRVVTPDGKEVQKRLSGFPTKLAAKAAYTDFVTEHCERAKTTRKAMTDIPTVGELLPAYLEVVRNQAKPGTFLDKQYVFDVYVMPELGELSLDELTRERLYQWQDNLWALKNPKTGDAYSFAYLRKVRSHLSSFLHWCESRYGYANNLSSVAMPKRRSPKTEMQFWNREEFEQFISVVNNPMYHALFAMMFFTGRRKGEILALTADDVKQDKIRFNKSVSHKTTDGSKYVVASTKADKSYSTPICEPLREELSKYVPQEPFYFGGESPLAPTTVTRYFNRYIESAGVKKIRLHDLRHSFVSMCIHLGANYTVVADLIGDTVEQVTKTYGHMYDEDKISIINRIV